MVARSTACYWFKTRQVAGLLVPGTDKTTDRLLVTGTG